MPDHVHLLISNPGVYGNGTEHRGSNLSDIIDWIKTKTANDYIVGVKKGLFLPFDKHLWQRNFYEHIIRNENDYEQKLYYIENNPQKWERDIIDIKAAVRLSEEQGPA